MTQAPQANDAPLVLAVPSKGRLQENATAFFGRAGLKFVKASGERGYRGTIAGVEGAEVAFLSASEIVAQLASGAAHLGITGEDLVREQLSDADAAVEMLTPLGFGHANVVVAVPQAWIDVRSMADLDDVASTMRARHGRKLRVATKYVNLTRRFFAEHGLADYRIVESLGATEGAPAAGTAEIVVDITTTGATLAANALKVLDDGVMLASEANLVASTRAPWDDRARAAARTILSRIAAEEEARTVREIRARLDLDASALAALTERFGARLPFGAPAAGAPLTLHCPDKAVFALVEELDRKGADDITVTAPTYVFRRANRLLERLDARI
ncbi:ATP phosphoribosyltransferase [Bosea sp. SSUT16]|jgi:ATP phosphoribosyltransferase|uniref:ATP phosphoribosyltransferase n=1 Tax=Bosea spartocytisi TaxID=2773451 RepID=A0A927I128_9HYPH|nr:ATP phosphoribosyltransferase [Bosea spartocytisi]MBD3847904.1 ATP phosphoribosyltransferase [Bosea spartocytisi]MCT4470252.1 ATP phosphoribosyltransferase [Bosea spartocytisi]